ncbi:PREDICTED: probable inactive protein kinase At3g63330 isoform X4 [Nelumbo nucifera]|uniref:Probable inactive protein kinase At3g63330 isoform X4 n=1 Tax=Nelumbo nucifera TaxID=4432 RepID=A0A1U8QCK0_NELNU|nr:PREDICTED: probable inactive protein kinase At3g63330 isoform X4 [Nelumbo nucifera]
MRRTEYTCLILRDNALISLGMLLLENMVICFEDEDTGRCSMESPSGDKSTHIKMRIIDFGSAIDEFTMKHLYGPNGPSRFEQTSEYSPPEALLNASWFQGATSITMKYDMWSVGVVILELILGSPHVFQLSARTHALLDQHLEGWNEGTKELAYKLRSFMEMCILIPGSSLKHHRSRNKKDLEERLSVDDALQHPYFQPPPKN